MTRRTHDLDAASLALAASVRPTVTARPTEHWARSYLSFGGKFSSHTILWFCRQLQVARRVLGSLAVHFRKFAIRQSFVIVR